MNDPVTTLMHAAIVLMLAIVIRLLRNGKKGR